MAKLNRVCFTCGKRHSYCPDCYDDKHLESWHIMFHDDNCKNIFDIINRHFYKHIATDEAINMLKTCDLSEIEIFNEDIKNSIKEILSYENKKPTADPVVISKRK